MDVKTRNLFLFVEQYIQYRAIEICLNIVFLFFNSSQYFVNKREIDLLQVERKF